ncbi:MAG: hypothetical protein CBB97_09800 [Candidatus Endolissoclinum sp. TMED37]|nr:MAG: hypothetical protein CBB97_09800 [Candidatus Endolissoclinum sp. TMED37]
MGSILWVQSGIARFDEPLLADPKLQMSDHRCQQTVIYETINKRREDRRDCASGDTFEKFTLYIDQLCNSAGTDYTPLGR